MKKLIAVAAIAAFMASPALAASTTVEFTGEDGAAQTWKFNDDGTAEGPDGATASYTWDEATRKLCATFAGETPQTLCATFEDNGGEGKVGEVAAYTLDDGRKGTAKIVAKEE
jgi:opacity protein-like surface antigen